MTEVNPMVEKVEEKKGREFYQFCKKHFEYEMRGITFKNKLKKLEEITQEWIEEGNSTWERIYRIQTKNKAVNIIIFSSVDMTTNEVRDNGKDAVRIVLEWVTKNGKMYKKVGKHQRIETLFKNVEKSLVSANGQVFTLQYKEFRKAEEA